MWFAIGAGVALVLVLANWRNIRRLKEAGSAQVSKFSRWIWRIDPIAVYQAEVDKSTEEIQEANEGLAEVRGMVSQYQRKVEKGETNVEQLKTKIKLLLQEQNEEKATTYVLELQRVQTEVTKNRQKLDEYNNLYETNLKKLKFANQKIRDAKEKAERMQSELRMSKAEAEVSKLAQNFQIKTSSIDNLVAIEDEIQRQIDSNRAKGQVIHDLGNDGLDELEDQEKRQKDQARLLLDQFKQEMLLPPPVEVKILPAMREHEKN